MLLFILEISEPGLLLEGWSFTYLVLDILPNYTTNLCLVVNLFLDIKLLGVFFDFCFEFVTNTVWLLILALAKGIICRFIFNSEWIVLVTVPADVVEHDLIFRVYIDIKNIIEAPKHLEHVENGFDCRVTDALGVTRKSTEHQ